MLELESFENIPVEVWCIFEKSEVTMSSFTAATEEFDFYKIGVSKVIILSLTSVLKNNGWSLLYLAKFSVLLKII